MKYATIALLALLTGCGQQLSKTPDGKINLGVNEFKLSDGTRCASIQTSNGVALTCGWKP